MIRITPLFLLLAAAFTISACNSEPTSEPFTAVSSDCAVTGNIFVWLDKNANGRVDFGEKPLPDISVGIDSPTARTDEQGRAMGSKFPVCCESECWRGHSAVIEIPKGYKATTPTQIPVTSMSGKKDKQYKFGLMVDTP